MNIGQLFNSLFYQPLFNLLIIICQFVPGNNFGLAIIILTLIVKLLFYPFGVLAIKNQKLMEGLKGKISEVQKKYQNDKQEQARQTMAIYKEAKISPFSGFLPLLVQLPILLALYRVSINGLKPESFDQLYSFIVKPLTISPYFINGLDLNQPSLVLTIIAGISQWFQSRQMKPAPGGQKRPEMEIIQKQMQFLFPIITVVILLKLPAAVALYWLVANIFTIFQQFIIERQEKKNVKPS